MPYFFDKNLDDDEDRDASQLQVSGASQISGPDGSSGSAPGNPEKQLNTGSGFQNLDKYLNVNKDQNFGGQFLGKVQGEIGNAQKGMEQGAETFKNQVSSLNKTPTSEQVSGAIADPKSVKPEEFQSWQNQTYKGPKNLSENQQAWNQYYGGTQKAETSAKLLGTEPGRFALLDSYYGRPNYNTGQKSLDNLLVQQQPGIGNTSKDIQNQATQLRAKGEKSAQELGNFAAQTASQVDQSGKSVKNALTGAIAGERTKAQSELERQNAERQGKIKSFQDILGQGNIPDQALFDQHGIHGGDSYYNLNPSSYFTPGEDLNINQTLTPENRSYIQALNELGGTTDDFASSLPQDVTDPYSFRGEQFANDLAGSKAGYEREYNSEIPNYPGGGHGTYAALQGIIDDYNNSPDPRTREYLADLVPDAQRRIDELNKKHGVSNKLNGGTVSKPSTVRPRG